MITKRINDRLYRSVNISIRRGKQAYDSVIKCIANV